MNINKLKLIYNIIYKIKNEYFCLNDGNITILSADFEIIPTYPNLEYKCAVQNNEYTWIYYRHDHSCEKLHTRSCGVEALGFIKDML